MFKTIHVLFVSLLMSGCYWKSDIHREFVVRNDVGSPLRGAEVYLVPKYSLCPPKLALPYEIKAFKNDRDQSESFREVTDRKGKFKVDIELYHPGEYAFFVISQGHYPTLFPVNSKSGTIILLDRKKFKIEQSPNHSCEIVFCQNSLRLPGSRFIGQCSHYRLKYGKVELAWLRIRSQGKISYNSWDDFLNFLESEKSSATYESYENDEGIFLQGETDALP